MAQDNNNCFTDAYPGLTLSDLKISPVGEASGETVCTAAEQTKSFFMSQIPPVSTDTFFWGAADLETEVGISGIWFSASSCGISPGVQTVSVGGTPKQYMQFSTTIMSDFDNTANSVLTQVKLQFKLQSIKYNLSARDVGDCSRL